MILVFPLGTPFLYWYLTCVKYRDTLQRIRDKAHHDRDYSKMKQLGMKLGDSLTIVEPVTLKQRVQDAKTGVVKDVKASINCVASVPTHVRRLSHSSRASFSSQPSAPVAAPAAAEAPVDLTDFDDDDVQRIKKIQAACRKRYGSGSSHATESGGDGVSPQGTPAGTSHAVLMTKDQQARIARPSTTRSKTSAAPAANEAPVDLTDFNMDDVQRIRKIQAACRRRYAQSSQPSPPASPPGSSTEQPKSSLWSKVGDKSLDDVERAVKPKKQGASSKEELPASMKIALRNEKANFNALPRAIQKLVADYEPDVYWFEAFECFRKMCMKPSIKLLLALL